MSRQTLSIFYSFFLHPSFIFLLSIISVFIVLYYPPPKELTRVILSWDQVKLTVYEAILPTFFSSQLIFIKMVLDKIKVIHE